MSFEITKKKVRFKNHGPVTTASSRANPAVTFPCTNVPAAPSDLLSDLQTLSRLVLVEFGFTNKEPGSKTLKNMPTLVTELESNCCLPDFRICALTVMV